MNHVIFAADEQYSIPLSVAIYSFCKQNPSSAEVHVLYSALSKKTLINLSRITKKFSNKLTLHCIDNNRFEKQKSNIEYITKATYYRYLIPEILTNTSTALYLDADILVNRNLKDVFEVSLGNLYAAGINDRCIENRDNGKYLYDVGMEHLKSRYINAGVLLLNLNKIREDNLQEAFFINDEQLKDKIQFQDQDILNYTFNGKIILLDKMMNWMSYERDRRRLFARFRNPYIVHFTGPNKPWIRVRSYWDKQYFNTLKECEKFLRME